MIELDGEGGQPSIISSYPGQWGTKKKKGLMKFTYMVFMIIYSINCCKNSITKKKWGQVFKFESARGWVEQ